jgi:crossover junction endodeoxyribonuclease RuvC
LRFVGSGTILSDGDMDLASRLCQLHDGLAEVVHSYTPDEAAVEQTFVNKDAVATLKLGQARGIAMLVPARAGLKVAEYAPNAVKKAVIGVGHGEKQ